MDAEEKVVFPLRLNRSFMDELRLIGKEDERSLNWLIVRAVRDFLERREREKGGGK